MWCGGSWVGRARGLPSEAVKVVWGLLGDCCGGGGVLEATARQNVGPEVVEWAEFLCDVELGSVDVPSFS